MITVDKNKCTGCGSCVSACMFGAVELREQVPYFTDACISCGACVGKCPEKALYLPEKAKKQEKPEEYKDVWVVLEADTEKQQLKKVSLELLSEARRLADLLGEKVGAVLLAEEMPENLEQTLSEVGCDYAHILLGKKYRYYDTMRYSKAAADLSVKHKPAVILLPATENGRDLAPRISCILSTGLTADCTALDIDEQKNLVQIRPTYGGNIMASIVSPDNRPQMASVRPNVFEVRETKEKRETRMYISRQETEAEEEGYTLTGVRELENAFQDVGEANIVIVAGYGVGSKENFKKIEKLALKMNAAVGATRKVVDEGWAPFDVQVGQTGKTIAPDLYIAFGVSGALQHMIGMKNARFKMAVNNDPAAPIFKLCDVPVLGDCAEVADALLKVIS